MTLHLEEVPLTSLKPHPKNYRIHPEDEISHLMESIRANGFYRNVVVARELTILAGHGVVEAARRLMISMIPVYRVPWEPDDPRSIKLLVGDNEIAHLVESNDRLLSELLRDLKEVDADLLGTGYTDMMLANLVMVTRPASEILDLDAAAQWVGMPGYDYTGGAEPKVQLLVNFRTEEDRQAFCSKVDVRVAPNFKRATTWWPPIPADDNRHIRFTDKRAEPESERAS